MHAPQFCAALDVRQGTVVLHRSAEAPLGYHGNAALAPGARPGTHRVAVIFYLTRTQVCRSEGRVAFLGRGALPGAELSGGRGRRSA